MPSVWVAVKRTPPSGEGQVLQSWLWWPQWTAYSFPAQELHAFLYGADVLKRYTTFTLSIFLTSSGFVKAVSFAQAKSFLELITDEPTNSSENSSRGRSNGQVVWKMFGVRIHLD